MRMRQRSIRSNVMNTGLSSSNFISGAHVSHWNDFLPSRPDRARKWNLSTLKVAAFSDGPATDSAPGPDAPSLTWARAGARLIDLPGLSQIPTARESRDAARDRPAERYHLRWLAST